MNDDAEERASREFRVSSRVLCHLTFQDNREMHPTNGLLLVLFPLVGLCSYVRVSQDQFSQEDIMDYVTNYIRHSRRIRVVTIYNKMPTKLSWTSMRFAQKITKEFPTVSVGIREALGPLRSQGLLAVKQWLNRRSQRKSLSLLFIDNDYEENVNRVLAESIGFIANLTVWDTRPRTIFFIVNSARDIELRDFFELSWSYKFLDIALIELVRSGHPTSYRPYYSPYTDGFSIFMHQFNPFNNTYYVRTSLDKHKDKMFIKKLNNLYGHTLRTGIFDDIPMVMIDRNYTGDDVWGLAQGMDVTITRTLAEIMNFTAKLNVIYTENPNVKRFNVSNEYMENALEKENIDFVVNFCGIIISKPLEDVIFESSIFLYTFSSNLIVKQYGKSVTKLSVNLMIITLVISATLVAFSIMIRVLRLDTKIWTTFNIAKIMVGISISADLREAYERVIFMTLAVISAALSVNILEQLLDIYLWRDVFLDLFTLQEVVDAGIVPTITHSTKKTISSYNHTALEKVLETSVLIDEEEVPRCIEMLINQNSVNGCEVDSILGKLMERSFADKERGWIITLVSEPIVQPCWTAMLLAKTSPYIGRFNYILRAFLESGLISYWYQDSLTNFTLMHRNFFGNEQLYHGDVDMLTKKHFLKSEKVSLNKKIILVLIIGYGISCLAFIFELVLAYCKLRI